MDWMKHKEPDCGPVYYTSGDWKIDYQWSFNQRPAYRLTHVSGKVPFWDLSCKVFKTLYEAKEDAEDRQHRLDKKAGVAA